MATTYATLQTEIADWLNRSDLTSRIPTFIQLAEAELRRQPAIQDERFTTLTLNSAIVTLPADCREVLELSLNNQGGHYGRIDLKSTGYIDAEQSKWGVTAGVPYAAAVVNDGTQLKLVRTPDQAYVANINYLTRLDALSATQTSNWVLTSYPDIYLYGSLKHSAPYLKHDERLATWGALYDAALAQLEAFVERRRYPGTLVARPHHSIGSRVHAVR